MGVREKGIMQWVSCFKPFSRPVQTMPSPSAADEPNDDERGRFDYRRGDMP